MAPALDITAKAQEAAAAPDPTSQHEHWTTAAVQYNDVIGKTTLHGTGRLVEVVNAAAPFTPASYVLDVGAGAGSLTVTVKNTNAAAQVLATDISDGMLEEIERLRLPGVATQREDAVTLTGVPDAAFSHSLSTFAIQFTSSALGAVRSLHRVTRPGGMVGIAIWGDAMGAAVIANQACANLDPTFTPAQPVVKGSWNTEAAHRKALEEAGFQDVATEVYEMPFEAGSKQGALDYWFRSTNPVPGKMIKHWEDHGGSRADLEREYARLLDEKEEKGEQIVCEAILGWGKKPLA